MSPEIYHGDYEWGKSDFPGREHFRTGAGAWCGRYSHEVHNHEIWTSGANGNSFDTSSVDSICMAFKGQIDRFDVIATYTKSDDGATVSDWILADQTGWSATEWTWQCFSISDLLSSANVPVNSQGYKKVTKIRLWNNNEEPIYIDELRIGKMKEGIGNFE